MIDFEKLTAFFPPEELMWKPGSTNKYGDKFYLTPLVYVKKEPLQDRLDAVCGPDKWQCDYQIGPDQVACGIGIKINGDWVWKWDGAGKTDFEGAKGAFTDAFKRAAKQWGIARYLNELRFTKPKQLVTTKPDRAWEWKVATHSDRSGPKTKLWWIPPDIPAKYLPASSVSPQPRQESPPPRRVESNGESKEWVIYELNPAQLETAKARIRDLETWDQFAESYENLVDRLRGSVKSKRAILPKQAESLALVLFQRWIYAAEGNLEELEKIRDLMNSSIRDGYESRANRKIYFLLNREHSDPLNQLAADKIAAIAQRSTS